MTNAEFIEECITIVPVEEGDKVRAAVLSEAVEAALAVMTQRQLDCVLLGPLIIAAATIAHPAEEELKQDVRWSAEKAWAIQKETTNG